MSEASTSQQQALLSETEYLTQERYATQKSEYRDGVLRAMAGAQPNHNRIVRNLLVNLDNCLRQKGCEIFPSDQLVYLPHCSSYVYPDLSVFCQPPEVIRKAQGGLDALGNPTIIVEVLSESTAADDQGRKQACYLQLTSLQQYVLVDSRKRSVAVYTRAEQNRWTYEVWIAEASEIPLAGCPIPLAEVYRNVDF